tara:strand:+ start:12463 stop:12672 length:210 start_codon:yes stop_codon:yes gene_type:complete
MRIPKYKQHEKMGQGDPMRMAGLDVVKPKLKTPKSPRNKKRYDKRMRNWRMTGDPDYNYYESYDAGDAR